MFKMKYFGLVINFWVMLVISLSMAIMMPLLAGAPLTAASVLIGWLEGFLISIVFDTIVPIVNWGFGLAAKCGLKRNTISYRLVSTLVPNFFNVTLLSFSMTAIGIGFPPYFVAAWLSPYPIAFIVCYIIAFFMAPVGEKLSLPLMKKEGPPENNIN